MVRNLDYAINMRNGNDQQWQCMQLIRRVWKMVGLQSLSPARAQTIAKQSKARTERLESLNAKIDVSGDRQGSGREWEVPPTERAGCPY